jgi:transposase
VLSVASVDIESLLARLAAMEARVVSLERTVASQRAEIGRKDGFIVYQQERIDKLEAALEESRRRSKRQAAPFSKGEPTPAPKTPGRKRGDAHGRHGHRRVPAGTPDRELTASLPGCCPDCGGRIVHERDATQWQVEVPEMRPTVTRITVEVGRCVGCRRRVQGRHPEQSSQALGAAGAGVGPKLKAWAMWLHYGMGLSFARAAKVISYLGVEVTAGAICQSSARAASNELVPVHAELVARANRSKTITMDESGWRVGGAGRWLWVAANDELTLCWIAPGRSFADAATVIGPDYDGVLVRDGWIVYDRYDKATHQSCTAHVLRRCAEMEADLSGADRKVPIAVKTIIKDALAARDLATPAERAAAAIDCQKRLDALCARPVGNDANRRLLKHLAHQASHLFTFLTIDDVQATNWQGEQAVRPCVVNRKTFGGNRTDVGARTQGIVTTVIATAAKQGHDVIDYLAGRARSPDPGLRILLG